jgi:hypothetical protein
MPPPRRTYDRVSASEPFVATTEETEDTFTNAPPLPIQQQRTGAYARVATADATAQEQFTSQQQQPSSPSTTSTNEDNEDDDLMELRILDFTQTTWTVHVSPTWTIAHVKQAGMLVHKVPIGFQRLVYRGKLLTDECTLQDYGITSPDTIVHLFPKPRVVRYDPENTSSSNDQETGSDRNDDNEGAHVPTIHVRADEDRAHILVLGSVEFAEAQNSIKLFSCMLLMMSAIELMNLLAIAMGVPAEQVQASLPEPATAPLVDDIFPREPPSQPSNDTYGNNNNSTNGTFGYNHNNHTFTNSLYEPPWGYMNTLDLLISVMGAYVALLGLSAASEASVKLARSYLQGTFVVGVGWMLFNYFVTVQMDLSIEHEHKVNHDDAVPDMTDSELYQSALSVMILPALVWFMCCARAFQFQQLLADAELEAATRIQSELEMSESHVTRSNTNHDEELALPTTTASPRESSPQIV